MTQGGAFLFSNESATHPVQIYLQRARLTLPNDTHRWLRRSELIECGPSDNKNSPPRLSSEGSFC